MISSATYNSIFLSIYSWSFTRFEDVDFADLVSFFGVVYEFGDIGSIKYSSLSFSVKTLSIFYKLLLSRVVLKDISLFDKELERTLHTDVPPRILFCSISGSRCRAVGALPCVIFTCVCVDISSI